MNGPDAAATRLPLVLVVDPVAASRQTMWRLLSPFFGVLEAPDGRRAEDWLEARPAIDALVVQSELPDVAGDELVKSLSTAQFAAASRAIVVTRPVDVPAVLRRLAGWFFARDVRKARLLVREAERLVS